MVDTTTPLASLKEIPMSVGVMSPMSHFGPMGHYGSMGHMGSPGATHAGGCHPVDESAEVQLSTELPSEDPSVEGACGAEGQDGEMDPNATTMNPQLLEMLAYMMMQFMAAFQQTPSSEGGGGGGGGGGLSGLGGVGGGGGGGWGGGEAVAAAPVEGANPGAQAMPQPEQGPAAVSEAPAQPATGGGDAGPLSGAAQTQALQPGESLQAAKQWKDNLKKDFGLNDAQAAGIVGNLWHESGGMNTGITQGGGIGGPNGNMADDNGNGYGIAQWGGVRKQGLIDFANANKLDPSSQAANYGYLKQELQGEYKGAIDAVKGTNDVAGATAAFCNSFEKPSDPQMASRVEYAMKLG
jgi:hypothetical protein